ncbi:MAG: BON domain-containing protein [Pseudomonadota bacterium]
MHGWPPHNTNMIRLKIFSLLTCLICLSGCTGLGVVTGAAAVTGMAAVSEGGISRAVSDGTIKLKINEAWFSYDVETFTKLKTKVNQGRVLLTGVVQDPQHRVEAVRLVWQVEGVKQVINEIRVAESEGIRGFVTDGYITSRLRTELTFDREVQSINYSIDTVQGITYLMGVAQNQAELNRVIEKARRIPGVKQVVSYVKLVGEPITETPSQSVSTSAPVAQVQPASMDQSPQPLYSQQPSISDDFSAQRVETINNQPRSIADDYYRE